MRTCAVFGKSLEWFRGLLAHSLARPLLVNNDSWRCCCCCRARGQIDRYISQNRNPTMCNISNHGRISPFAYRCRSNLTREETNLLKRFFPDLTIDDCRFETLKRTQTLRYHIDLRTFLKGFKIYLSFSDSVCKKIFCV